MWEKKKTVKTKCMFQCFTIQVQGMIANTSQDFMSFDFLCFWQFRLMGVCFCGRFPPWYGERLRCRAASIDEMAGVGARREEDW